ncbi:MAG: PilZ domain-containing protein [Desulfobacteraceae bacterium]|nr:MAG: PilZ domain-containing protein [Desulfobacteraceae bacterium]
MALEEKRLYPRLTLRIEDGYFGNFKLPDQESLVAPIVNLSAGGINMAVPEKFKDKIAEGDLLLLRGIAGGANMAFISEVKGEIRWIKKLEATNYLSVGCRFLELTEGLRAQLTKFVNSERMARGQYD